MTDVTENLDLPTDPPAAERSIAVDGFNSVLAAAPAPSSTIWSAAFWKGAGERGVKTFAQSSLAAALLGATGNLTGITDINWEQVASIGALATVLSVLTSIGNASFTAGKQP